MTNFISFRNDCMVHLHLLYASFMEKLFYFTHGGRSGGVCG